ncbi:MAG: hypothetical protein A4E23_00446 [Methanomethylovorans sp. PtaU1.Bin073]|nr:MAG: hypothetical protein A4E23_00446 [Methanomethylovorans sp. PtaU1.Bin073]
MMFLIFLRKKGSIAVSSVTSSTEKPVARALYITKSLSLVGVFRSAGISLSFQSPLPRHMSISSDLIALSNDSSMVLPMAITSPVLFMAVVKVLSAVTNLSNGQRGIFVTM